MWAWGPPNIDSPSSFPSPKPCPSHPAPILPTALSKSNPTRVPMRPAVAALPALLFFASLSPVLGDGAVGSVDIFASMVQPTTTPPPDDPSPPPLHSPPPPSPADACM